MKIINPYTLEIIKEIPSDTVTSIQEKMIIAKDAQLKWKNYSVSERIKCIVRFANKLDEQKERLAKDLTDEMGKPLNQSKSEITSAISRIEFFIHHSEQFLNDETVFHTNEITEKIVYEPLGVIANISAWNYPYLVGVNVFIPALISGNAVLYKPSEYASLSGKNITQLLYESGIPKGLFQCIIGDGLIGKALLNMDVDGFFFTGSYKTGMEIKKNLLGKNVPVQLELGGKDPAYVSENISNVNSVADLLAEGAFYNTGQSCCAVERIYIHEKHYDTFVEHFLKKINSFKCGDPKKKGTYIGVVTRPKHLKFLLSQIEDAKLKGATCVAGGEIIDQKFLTPTVLLNVTHDMSIMMEESFGPIIGIQRVSSDEEAIKLMSDTVYGLTSSVFSDNEAHGTNLLNQLDTGTVYLNCSDRVSPYLPWAGRKHSGIGLTLSHLSIRTFTKTKAFHIKS